MPSLYPLLPEIFLSCSAMTLLMVGVFIKPDIKGKRAVLLAKVSLILLLVVAVWLVYQTQMEPVLAMNGFFILDNFAVFAKLLIVLSAVFVLCMALSNGHKIDGLRFEFIVLILMAVIGMMVMVSANDLMSLYMGLELQSLSLYVITAMDRKNEKASEAGLKYFMLGALASGIYLYGASLLYGISGTTSFTGLNIFFENSPEGVMIPATVSMVLIITALLFKISAAPFHMWTPDVYEGGPKVVVAFFATASKVAAIGLFVRFLTQPFMQFDDAWRQIFILVSVLTMFTGAFGALKQRNIKRLMAYSSIGHMGFILMGLAAGGLSGVQAVLIYTAIYVFMSAGVFAGIVLMRRHGIALENIGELSGLATNNSIVAFIIALLMFSMAGIPPLAGFFAKFFILKAAMEAQLYMLAVTGVITSVISAFYYIRIVKIMYFDTPNEAFDADRIRAVKLVLYAAGIFNGLLVLNPTPLLEYARLASESLF